MDLGVTMSKSYSVNQPFNVTGLQSSLTAAGVNVLTINASNYDAPTGIAQSGTVVTDDNAVDATVNAVIAALPSAIALAQQTQIATLYAQTIVIRMAAYDPQTYTDLLTFIVFNGANGIQPLPNRFNYVLKAFQFTGWITNAFITVSAVINAALTPADALAVQLGPTQAQAGNLATNGTLSGLASTAQISVGMTVTGPGITGNATVATVPSGTSVTLTGGTYTVQTGQTYTFALPPAPVVTVPGALAINS